MSNNKAEQLFAFLLDKPASLFTLREVGIMYATAVKLNINPNGVTTECVASLELMTQKAASFSSPAPMFDCEDAAKRVCKKCYLGVPRNKDITGMFTHRAGELNVWCEASGLFGKPLFRITNAA